VKRHLIFIGRAAGRGAFKGAAVVGAFAIIVAAWWWDASLLTAAAGRKSSAHQNHHRQIAV